MPPGTFSGQVRAYWMGKRMSGTLSCASIVPSTNSTREWTIDWGWISTWMRPPGMSKSQRASIISKALFIKVAESTVTFGPMFQVGWARASAKVALASLSGWQSRKAPPLAVKSSRSTSAFLLPSRHWKMALCSLSTGRTFTAVFFGQPP